MQPVDLSATQSMLNRILFLSGLLLEVVGHVLLAQGNEFVYRQQPIDFAHWFLLVGVVMMIPQVVTFPRKGFNYVGIPLTLIGIVCVIGMCVLDFVWWSLPDQESREALASHLMQQPSIWGPFISIGSSSKVFNAGLLLLSLNFFKRKKLGVVLILIATLILMRLIPISPRLVVGYVLTFLGFSLIFLEDLRPAPRSETCPEAQKRDASRHP